MFGKGGDIHRWDISFFIEVVGLGQYISNDLICLITKVTVSTN